MPPKGNTYRANTYPALYVTEQPMSNPLPAGVQVVSVPVVAEDASGMYYASVEPAWLQGGGSSTGGIDVPVTQVAGGLVAMQAATGQISECVGGATAASGVVVNVSGTGAQVLGVPAEGEGTYFLQVNAESGAMSWSESTAGGGIPQPADPTSPGVVVATAVSSGGVTTTEVKAFPNNAQMFLDGTGNFSVPSGGAGGGVPQPPASAGNEDGLFVATSVVAGQVVQSSVLAYTQDLTTYLRSDGTWSAPAGTGSGVPQPPSSSSTADGVFIATTVVGGQVTGSSVLAYTEDTTKYLRADGSWDVPAGGSGGGIPQPPPSSSSFGGVVIAQTVSGGQVQASEVLEYPITNPSTFYLDGTGAFSIPSGGQGGGIPQPPASSSALGGVLLAQTVSGGQVETSGVLEYPTTNPSTFYLDGTGEFSIPATGGVPQTTVSPAPGSMIVAGTAQGVEVATTTTVGGVGAGQTGVFWNSDSTGALLLPVGDADSTAFLCANGEWAVPQSVNAIPQPTVFPTGNGVVVCTAVGGGGVGDTTVVAFPSTNQEQQFLNGFGEFSEPQFGIPQTTVAPNVQSLLAIGSANGTNVATTYSVGGTGTAVGAFWNASSGASVLATGSAPTGSFLSSTGEWTVPTGGGLPEPEIPATGVVLSTFAAGEVSTSIAQYPTTNPSTTFLNGTGNFTVPAGGLPQPPSSSSTLNGVILATSVVGGVVAQTEVLEYPTDTPASQFLNGLGQFAVPPTSSGIPQTTTAPPQNSLLVSETAEGNLVATVSFAGGIGTGNGAVWNDNAFGVNVIDSDNAVPGSYLDAAGGWSVPAPSSSSVQEFALPQSTDVSVRIGPGLVVATQSVDGKVTETQVLHGDPGVVWHVGNGEGVEIVAAPTVDPTTAYFGGDGEFHPLPVAYIPQTTIAPREISLLGIVTVDGVEVESTGSIGGRGAPEGVLWNSGANGVTLQPTSAAPSGSYLSAAGAWTVPVSGIPQTTSAPAPSSLIAAMTASGSEVATTSYVGGIGTGRGVFWNDNAFGADVVDATGAAAGSFLSANGAFEIPAGTGIPQTISAPPVSSLLVAWTASGSEVATTTTAGGVGTGNGVYWNDNAFGAVVVDASSAAPGSFLSANGDYEIPSGTGIPQPTGTPYEISLLGIVTVDGSDVTGTGSIGGRGTTTGALWNDATSGVSLVSANASASTFLRGDGSWATPGSGGGGIPQTSTAPANNGLVVASVVSANEVTQSRTIGGTAQTQGAFVNGPSGVTTVSVAMNSYGLQPTSALTSDGQYHPAAIYPAMEDSVRQGSLLKTGGNAVNVDGSFYPYQTTYLGGATQPVGVYWNDNSFGAIVVEANNTAGTFLDHNGTFSWPGLPQAGQAVSAGEIGGVVVANAIDSAGIVSQCVVTGGRDEASGALFNLNGTGVELVSLNASNTTFLRGDGTWATVPTSGGGVPQPAQSASTQSGIIAAQTVVDGEVTVSEVLAYPLTNPASYLLNGAGEWTASTDDLPQPQAASAQYQNGLITASAIDVNGRVTETQVIGGAAWQAGVIVNDASDGIKEVPYPSTDSTTKFLRGDGTWAAPGGDTAIPQPNAALQTTNDSVLVTGTTVDSSGIVTATKTVGGKTASGGVTGVVWNDDNSGVRVSASAGDEAKFLAGDGSWKTPDSGLPQVNTGPSFAGGVITATVITNGNATSTGVVGGNGVNSGLVVNQLNAGVTVNEFPLQASKFLNGNGTWSEPAGFVPVPAIFPATSSGGLLITNRAADGSVQSTSVIGGSASFPLGGFFGSDTGTTKAVAATTTQVQYPFTSSGQTAMTPTPPGVSVGDDPEILRVYAPTFNPIANAFLPSELYSDESARGSLVAVQSVTQRIDGVFVTTRSKNVGGATAPSGPVWNYSGTGAAVVLGAGGANTYLDGTGNFSIPSTPSSLRYKEAIVPLENAYERVKRLRPVSYRYKENLEQERLGFIAEETDVLFPQATVKREGEIDGLHYGDFAAPLCAAIQTIQKRLEDVEEELRVLKKHRTESN